VLAIESALMGITRCAVFAKRVDAYAQAIQALIQDDSVPRAEALRPGPGILDDADDLMAQRLGLPGQRDDGPRSSVL
jgi:hypothetical protein